MTIQMCLTIVGLLSLVSVALAEVPRDGEAGAAPSRPVIELTGDVEITSPTVWEDADYRIRGNLILGKGGDLTVRRCTVELINTYSRQYCYWWLGGTLTTSDSTIGGTCSNGVISQSNFELLDGLWTATDTTVRYTYGIVFDGSGRTVGRLEATRFIQGPNADSVIMGGKGQAVLRDSTYNVSLTAYAGRAGGRAVFNLPVDTSMNAVFDHQSLPGAEYRLELVNTKVPYWWLFLGGVQMDGPDLEIILADCPWLIPNISASNLRGVINLPTFWGGQLPAEGLRTGNVVWRTVKPAGIGCWGVYLSGDKTDLTLTGPTMLCELMMWNGKVKLQGTDGTHDAATSATTVEVYTTGKGSQAELLFRNAAIGSARTDGVRGHVAAHGRSKVVMEHCTVTDTLLMTDGKATMEFRGVIRQGTVDLRPNGGPITDLGAASQATSEPVEDTGTVE